MQPATIRRLLVIFSAVVSLSLSVTVVSARTPRMPISAADWATFTPSERTAAVAYAAVLSERALARGQVEHHSVTATVTQSLSSPAPTISTCGLQWDNYPWGTYIYAWGEAGFYYPTVHATYIAAGKQSKPGRLLRDGNQVQTFWQEWWNPDYHNNAYTVVNPQSPSDFKWPFEHPNYTGRSYNTVRAGTTYWVGPDAVCSVTAQL
jgi:hypothetical protein